MDAGINPFIELDLDNLPAEGDQASDYFPGRKVYGNLVDGIPELGLRIKSDGTLTYDTDQTAKLTTIDVDTGAILGDTIAMEILQNQKQINTKGWSRTYNTAAVNHLNVGIHNIQLTLVGGAKAATGIFAPGAGNKFAVYWVELSSDLAGAAGGQTYVFTFTEETTGEAYGKMAINTMNMPYRVFPCNDAGSTRAGHGTTDDKDLMLQVAGGDAGEDIYCQICAGTF